MKLKELLFESEHPGFFKTREETEAWLKKMNIKNYTINKDLTVDVNEKIDISSKNLKFIPVQFGKVTGDFYCSENHLTTLEGAPREVGGEFGCSYNQLTTLEGCPREVGVDFNCFYNQLTTLEGCPRELGGDFYCSENPNVKNPLHLLKIHGLQESYFDNKKVEKILNKHLPNALGIRGLLNCQEELIENDLEEYAEL